MADDVHLAYAPMAGHLASTRDRFALLSHQAKHEIRGGVTKGNHQGEIAIIGNNPVFPSFKCKRCAYLRSFMADPRDVKGNFSLPMQNPGALIQSTRQEHRRIDFP
jgi:hypothetical protein